MPEAIATSKRKFYKALDALTNSSASLSQPNTESCSSSTSKRSSTAAAAFDEARERARKRLRQSVSTTSLTTLDQNVSAISLPRKATAKDNKPPPNFSPWSQETFLARLKTFSSVSLWHPKPDAINEVEWAKRGWVCVDVNTVACKGGCERRVVVSLDMPESKDMSQKEMDEDEDDAEAAAFEEALAQRYKSMIVDGHSSSCMWHKAGCKDDIYRLAVVRPSVWQPELRTRYKSLLQVRDSIVNIKTRPLDESNAKLLDELPRGILNTTPEESSASSKAFEIAMHGWRGSAESGNQLLHCDACFQRIGLWMYQPDYSSPRTAGGSGDSGSEEGPAIVDIEEMHRDHCPWRNSETQKATGSLSGLDASQILHRVVSTCAHDHRRRSDHYTVSQENQLDDPDGESAVPGSPTTTSREDIARQDKERESRLHKLKNLFNIKRRSTIKAPAKSTA